LRRVWMSNDPEIHSMSLFVVTHSKARMPGAIQCELVYRKIVQGQARSQVYSVPGSTQGSTRLTAEHVGK
jgi:hypothetical protein